MSLTTLPTNQSPNSHVQLDIVLAEVIAGHIGSQLPNHKCCVVVGDTSLPTTTRIIITHQPVQFTIFIDPTSVYMECHEVPINSFVTRSFNQQTLALNIPDLLEQIILYVKSGFYYIAQHEQRMRELITI